MKNHVRLVYTGKIKKVLDAVQKTNEILSSPEFYQQIRLYKKFDHCELSPDMIANLMENSGHLITVKVNWFLPAGAGANPHRITVCRDDFNGDLAAGVNTLIYQTVSAINSLHYKKSQRQAGHDQMTASWVIGAIAEVMVK